MTYRKVSCKVAFSEDTYFFKMLGRKLYRSFPNDFTVAFKRSQNQNSDTAECNDFSGLD